MNLTAKQQLRRNPQNAGYSNPIKTYSVPATSNEDGTLNVPAQPVYPIDPNVEPIQMTMPVRQYGMDNGSSGAIASPSYTRSVNAAISSNPFSPAAVDNGFVLFAINELYNNVANGWEALRTPQIFKTLGLTTAAGDTALWDPAAGKKFRLMGVIIDIAAGTTAAAASLLQLRDNAVVISNHTICGGALAASAGRTLVNHVFPGNGYLSVAADNIQIGRAHV